MHFRPYHAEFSLGDPRVREDLLGIIPRNKCVKVSSSSTDAQSRRVASAPAASPPRGAAGLDGPLRQQYPKRVSFTSEERVLTEHPSLSGDNESEDGDVKKESEQSVAEILRQMSQAPGGSENSSAAAAASFAGPEKVAFANAAAAKVVASMKALGSAEQEAALTLAGKRNIPTSFHNAESGEASTKRVRWMPPSAPQDSSARFFHRMPRRSSANSTSWALASAPVVPVLKPVPGLKSYDVLIGRDFISHFNLGNRRLLVLALANAKAYASGEPEDQEDIVESLYNAIESAGGRFVQMEGQTSGYEATSEEDAKEAIAKVLFHQEKHRLAGKDIISMFQRKCASMWGGNVAEDDDDDEEDEDKKPAATVREVDDESVSDDSYNPSNWRKTIKKFEPMTPLGHDFQPGPFDVICSRGSAPRKHPGNIWFVSLVEQNCERYISAEGKMAKSVIVSEILDIVRKNSPGGGFIKMDEDNRWCETGDHLAREKIGQCFRDRLHTRYSSSSRAKLEKRRNNRPSKPTVMFPKD